MKIKIIERLAKANGGLELMEEETTRHGTSESEHGRQWAAVGGAFYPLDGMPYLTAETVCACLNLSQKQKDNMIIQEGVKPEWLSFEDWENGERSVDKLTLRVTEGSHELEVYQCDDGQVIAVQYNFMKPFEKKEDIAVYSRTTDKGVRYLAVKDGVSLRALILPWKFRDQTVETMGKLYNGAAIALEESRRGKEPLEQLDVEAAEAEMGGQ